MRESPALDVMGLLQDKGANVGFVDPYVPEVHAREWSGRVDVKSEDPAKVAFGRYDCVVVVTDHKTFDYDAEGDTYAALVTVMGDGGKSAYLTN